MRRRRVPQLHSEPCVVQPRLPPTEISASSRVGVMRPRSNFRESGHAWRNFASFHHFLQEVKEGRNFAEYLCIWLCLMDEQV
ncbi:hypothetical protein AZA_10078 [Nitrospirillum viridazoti Y2]|nr:hypothetical protein AZA_10078 [Nitrospirillum amazonense Y2]